MTLCFCNYLNINLKDIEINRINIDNLELFFEIYEQANAFAKSENKDIIKKLFNLLINMGYNLGFSDDEIVKYCLNKINKDVERLNK